MDRIAYQYVPFALFFIIALAFGAVTLTVGMFVRPRNPDPEKSIPYECGNDPVGEANIPIFPRYYFFAMLLVVFDIEAVFLVPWALDAASHGYGGLAAVGLFFLMLMAGYLYLWRKGDLNWD